MTRKTVYADEVKAAMQLALNHVVELREAWMTGALSECDGKGGTRSNRNVDVEMALRAAIDAIPAAEPKALLDPGEVKAVLAEALASQPMAKVWAEAAINAMCGKVVGEPAAEGGERVARPPMLLASIGDGSRAVWWTRQGDDLWESQRIFGVSTHAGSKSLIVDRTASDEAALKLYDADVAAGGRE